MSEPHLEFLAVILGLEEAAAGILGQDGHWIVWLQEELVNDIVQLIPLITNDSTYRSGRGELKSGSGIQTSSP